jgi:hypothetical protein
LRHICFSIRATHADDQFAFIPTGRTFPENQPSAFFIEAFQTEAAGFVGHDERSGPIDLGRNGLHALCQLLQNDVADL